MEVIMRRAIGMAAFTVLVVAHTAVAPLFLLLWLAIPVAIWLEDRGPVFYRSQRSGRDGRDFTVLKFRTMVPNADRAGPAWTKENDPRLTRVGRILRPTALDELPQVLSIWKGDMSFVGPRALPVKEQQWLEGQIPGFDQRLKGVRPGLTGLSQVYNRADEAHAKLRYDLEYVQRMSLGLDIELILRSAFNTLVGRWDTRSGKSSPENTNAL
jgi:lipopolysaccharide/colanic/teichoic acid biosynthesis glycosyltransferase